MQCWCSFGVAMQKYDDTDDVVGSGAKATDVCAIDAKSDTNRVLVKCMAMMWCINDASAARMISINCKVREGGYRFCES